MARATTKSDLQQAASTQYDKLWLLIYSLSDEEKNAKFQFDGVQNLKEAHWNRDENIRDVIVHLYEWHQLLLNWVHSNQNGEAKPFIPEPYNWKNYGQMNVEFWKKHQETPLDTAIELFKNSHQSVLSMIDTFSNDTLFSKGALAWTGTSPLGSYCTSATASHYDWAMKKIKLHMKTQRSK